MTELLPNWKEEGAPVTTPATEDKFFVLSENRAFRIPTPKQMHNKGNFVVSLRYLTSPKCLDDCCWVVALSHQYCTQQSVVSFTAKLVCVHARLGQVVVLTQVLGTLQL